MLIKHMKTFILAVGFLAAISNCPLSAAVIAGPITNPANGHDYYLLSPDSWTSSETAAEHLGGTLAIIKNAGDQEWVYSTFAKFGGTNRNLWIGLCRNNPDRALGWVTGGKGEYANWAGGQPDDAGRVEGYVFMSSTRPWGVAEGTWADCANEAEIAGTLPNGIVEVPGKSKEKSLSAAEKALRGAWYAAGKADCPCYIASTDHALFIINESNSAGRVVVTRDGLLFVASWRLYGQADKDKILWRNGTWWSRHPVPNDSASVTIKPGDLEKAAGPPVDVPILK